MLSASSAPKAALVMTKSLGGMTDTACPGFTTVLLFSMLKAQERVNYAHILTKVRLQRAWVKMPLFEGVLDAV